MSHTIFKARMLSENLIVSEDGKLFALRMNKDLDKRTDWLVCAANGQLRGTADDVPGVLQVMAAQQTFTVVGHWTDDDRFDSGRLEAFNRGVVITA